MIYPPLDSNLLLPNLPLTDDKGETGSLHDLIRENPNITLLIPGFMSCHGVCPQLAQLYKSVLRDAGLKSEDARHVSVVFFSFDPNDTPSSLAMFRSHMDLPSDWKVVQSTPEATQSLLSALNYTVMKSDGGYQHPAQAFAFTRDLRWLGSLYGTDIKAKEVTELLSTARFRQEYPTLSATLEYVQSPNFTAVAAGSGFVLALFFVLWLAVRLKPSHKKTPSAAA